MTLEDFFTLTEMKDGLTSHSRVEELISVMQKDKESVVKNVAEAARQWSTVASTLAATENGDTLDHFVRLDGLLFLDGWLQDAQKSNNEVSVEESVSLLLGVLEKLPIDNKRFVSSGIGATVKKLLSHKSCKVQERARAVFDGWNQGSDSDGDQKSIGGCVDDRVSHADEAVVAPESRCLQNSCQTDGNLVGNDQQHPRSSDSCPSEGIRNVKSFVTSNRDNSHTTLNHENKEDGFRENTLGICSNSEILKLKDISNGTKETTDVRNGSSDNVSKKETSCPSSLYDEPAIRDPAMQPDVPVHTDAAKEADSIEMPLSADDTCTQPIESEEQKHLSSGMEIDGPDVSHSDVMEKSSYDGNPDDAEACSSEKRDLEASENSGESGSKLEKDNVDEKYSVISSKMNTDMDEFDYGMDDALEVARQVAKQVEREVVHYREELCSSSSSETGSGVVRPGSPDSKMGGQDECVAESEDHLDKKITEECVQKSDPMVVAEKPGVDESKKGVCDIDLNEVFSEEVVEHHHPPSTITFVSASKVTPAGVPKAPFHFEGELGWKGCAATSAFRPASASARPAVSSSLPRKGFLDFDLNVAECCGDGPVPIPIPIPIPSGESSIEVSSRRAERLKLDLNRIGDNEDNPSSSPASSSSSRQFPMRNIDLNGNPSSLFEDAGDPIFFGKRSSSDMISSGGFKLDDPVISIMGARVSVNRPEIIPQTRSFLPNESPQINASALLTRRDTNAFTRKADNMNHHSFNTNPSMFGYNGLSMPPAMYGPVVPCMLDSRGSPVVPQMMMPSASADVRPFFMSMSMSMGVPVMSLNGGMPRPSFDLNSGFSPSDGQLYIPGGQGLRMEEQMNPASAGGLGMKRKERDEGGWDFGYKHQPPPPWR